MADAAQQAAEDFSRAATIVALLQKQIAAGNKSASIASAKSSVAEPLRASILAACAARANSAGCKAAGYLPFGVGADTLCPTEIVTIPTNILTAAETKQVNPVDGAPCVRLLTIEQFLALPRATIKGKAGTGVDQLGRFGAVGHVGSFGQTNGLGLFGVDDILVVGAVVGAIYLVGGVVHTIFSDVNVQRNTSIARQRADLVAETLADLKAGKITNDQAKARIALTDKIAPNPDNGSSDFGTWLMVAGALGVVGALAGPPLYRRWKESRPHAA